MTERNLKIQIYKATLPAGLHGVTFKNDTDDFTVAISDQDSEDRRALSFLHECLHIWHYDHDKTGAKVSALEKERHEEMLKLLKLATEDTGPDPRGMK